MLTSTTPQGVGRLWDTKAGYVREVIRGPTKTGIDTFDVFSMTEDRGIWKLILASGADSVPFRHAE